MVPKMHETYNSSEETNEFEINQIVNVGEFKGRVGSELFVVQIEGGLPLQPHVATNAHLAVGYIER
jgi:hypothetical protein